MDFLQYWEEHKLKYVGFNISDKGTQHDYIETYYANEFNDIKYKELRLVEIGIGDGYSLVLWREWFTKAEIFAIELYPYAYQHDVPFEIEGATSIFKNAYTQETLDMFEDNTIDYLIDDGSHSFEHQIYCIEHWLAKIKNGGKLVIEDVQDIDHIKTFEKIISDNNLNVSFKTFDMRQNKDRYDDIIFEITKKI